VRDNLWEASPWWTLEPWIPFREAYKDLLPENDDEFFSLVVSSVMSRVESVKKGLVWRPQSTLDLMASRQVIDAMRQSSLLRGRGEDGQLEQLELLLNQARRHGGSAKQQAEWLEEALHDVGLLRNEVLASIFQEAILESCLIIRVDGSNILVDHETSSLIFDEVLKDLPGTSPLSQKKKLLVSVLMNVVTDQAMHDIFQHLLESAENIAVAIGDMVVVDELEAMDPKEAIPPGDDAPLPVTDHMIPTSVYTVVQELTEVNDAVSKLIELRSSLTRLHGNPWMAESPMGADVYQTILSVIKELMAAGFIAVGNTIIDAAAGRGECGIAIRACGLDVVSLNRIDTYSIARHTGQVRFIDGYTLTGKSLPEELVVEASNIGLKDSVVLVDISHVGKDSDRLVDRLMDMLSLSELVIVRLAAVQIRMGELMKACHAKGVETFITVTGNGLMQSATSYFLMRGNNHLQKKEVVTKGPTALVDRLIRDCRLLQRDGPRTDYTDGPNSCSVINDLGGAEKCRLALVDRLESLVYTERRKALSRLTTMKKRVNGVPVSERFYQDCVRNYPTGECPISIVQGTMDDVFEMIGSTPDSDEKASFSKFWNKDPQYVLDMKKADAAILLKASTKLRPLRYRKMVRAILLIDYPSRVNTELSAEEFISDMWKTSAQLASNSSARARSMMDALMLLIWDVLANKPSQHKQILSLALRSGIVPRSEVMNIAYYRKMMSALYMIVSDFFRLDSNRLKFGRPIVNSAYERFVRPTSKAKVVKVFAQQPSRGERQNQDSSDVVTTQIRQQFVQALDSMLSCADIFNMPMVDSVSDLETVDGELTVLGWVSHGLSVGSFEFKFGEVVKSAYAASDGINTSAFSKVGGELEDEEQANARMELARVLALNSGADDDAENW
jgi:hypothetical protein